METVRCHPTCNQMYPVIIAGLVLLLSGQSARSQLTSCACYGDDVNIDSVTPDCSSTAGVIGIVQFYRGTKLTSSGCPQTATTGTRDVANCCTYDVTTNDCQSDVESNNAAFTDCSGHQSCSHQVTWVATPASCTTLTLTYLPFTNFMCMEYYCFPSSAMAPLCDTSNTEFTGTSLHIRNDEYPSPTQLVGCCACAVTATASGATITLKSVDFRLHDASSTCQQSVDVNEGGSGVVYTCANNNNMVIQTLYTSTGNSVSVTLMSSVSGNGYLWIWAEVSHGNMGMTCGSVNTCPGLTTLATTTPVTSTTVTVATTSTSTASAADITENDSSDSDSDTFLLGLSLKVFLIIAGLLGCIAVMALGCLCYCCYHHGKKARGFNIEERRQEDTHAQVQSQTTNAASSPVFTGIRSNYSSASSVTDNQSRYGTPPTDVQTNAPSLSPQLVPGSGPVPHSRFGPMFVHRPFDPHFYTSGPRKYTSLTHVDSV